MLGSPFRGLRTHPVLRVAAGLVRAGADLPQLAVVTRQDGVVDWRCCVDPATTHVVEVDATHIGLAFNATVYAALARKLATPRSGMATR